MMNDNIEMQDYYLYINWEDSQKNIYRVGILAKINDTYYMRTYERKPNDERDAYSHGYIGIPGFIPGELYKSTNELFDFFQKRVSAQEQANQNIDYYQELLQSEGRTLTDSFSIEKMPESHQKKCKEVLIAMDELKQRQLKRKESQPPLSSESPEGPEF